MVTGLPQPSHSRVLPTFRTIPVTKMRQTTLTKTAARRAVLDGLGATLCEADSATAPLCPSGDTICCGIDWSWPSEGNETLAINLYPRPGTVSIKRGRSGSSFRASLIFLIALLILRSVSTNTSGPHRDSAISFLATSSPGFLRSSTRRSNGCFSRRILRPCRLTSNFPRSISTSSN